MQFVENKASTETGCFAAEQKITHSVNKRVWFNFRIKYDKNEANSLGSDCDGGFHKSVHLGVFMNSLRVITTEKPPECRLQGELQALY